jgi:hypothetical protein
MFFSASNRSPWPLRPADQANSWLVGNPYLRIISAQPVIQKEQLLIAAETDAACSIPPRTAHRVTRNSCSIFLASGEQFPSDQPTHRSLRRTLRQSNRLGQFLITHLNGSLPACLLNGEPYIDEEAGRFPIMPGQVTHQHVYHVIVQIQHGYTDH